MEIGLVQKIDIDEEMQQAYLDYAMSVIVSRALPDARDGLKPVHRRILYAMYDMGLRPDTSYKKSARIVGEVLGKYHPHGDMAVYDAMARMAQSFSMRLRLVDGQGNFGSIDGDPPAAMRYTEARMAVPAGNMLADIEKNTVDFTENFDDSLLEPTVLPSAIPNLLVNGATGIAVGMSTSIPPHNLEEVVDALRYMLDHWNKLDDIGLEDVMQFIKGPDFPTGGVIIQTADGDSLSNAYGTGRGRITLQARAHVEEMERGRSRIIITELPYMTNKASLIEKIADLAREERVEGIADLRDESDREGLRIVIELSRGTDPDKVLLSLYKSTPLRGTFSIIMLALVDGEPRLLGLKQALRVYIEHRIDIIRRRSKHDLERARRRAHILEGLRTALENLDEVIDLIRRSRTVDSARTNLKRRFKLSDEQTTAILDMPLRRLASLERKKIEDEYAELRKQISGLEALLASPVKMRRVVGDELQAVREAYGDPRRTQIVRLKEGETQVSALRAADMVPDKTVWVMVSEDGKISKTPDEKSPRPSGKDAPYWLVQANSRDTLYLVDQQGQAAAISIHNIPNAEKPSEGTALERITPFTENNLLAALIPLPPKDVRAEDWTLVSVTRQGMVKKSLLSELPGPSAGTFTIVRVNEGDQLGWLGLSQGGSEIFMVTRNGMSIRFSEEEVRPMGLVAAGVIGIKLQKGDEVAGFDLLPKGKISRAFFIASDGTAKRVPLSQFPTQGRYGQGVTAWKLPRKVTVVGMAVEGDTTRITLHLKILAAKSARIDEAPPLTRTARGQKVLELKEKDEVIHLTVPWEPKRPLKPAGKRKASEPDGASASPAKSKRTRRTSSRKRRTSNGRKKKS